MKRLSRQLEHRVRRLLMELFARLHNRPRPTQGFQEEAGGSLQALLGATLPQFDLQSIQKALLNLLDILEHSLELFTGRKILLTQVHQNIIKQVRARQHIMDLSGM